MKEIIHKNKYKRWFFFVTGMIATVAYRAILFTGELSSKILWYVGTIGFILYFWHRSNIQKKRSSLVKENNLIQVVNNLKKIDKKQKEAMLYLVSNSLSSKAKWNSFAIFLLSLVALILAVILDFML